MPRATATTAAIASRAAIHASTVPSACCGDTAIVGASPVVASWSSSANAAAAASRAGGIGGTFSATIRTRSAASTASRPALRGQASDGSLPCSTQRPASSNSAHGTGRDREGGDASKTRNVFIGSGKRVCAAVYRRAGNPRRVIPVFARRLWATRLCLARAARELAHACRPVARRP